MLSIHSCPLDLIRQRIATHYIPQLSADRQRVLNLEFAEPTTKVQKAEEFAAFKSLAAKDRVQKIRRLVKLAFVAIISFGFGRRTVV